MSDFIIKGTVAGFTLEKWITDLTLFSSTSITLMNTWARREFTPQGILIHENHRLIKESYGEVKLALIAIENDIHNLSVNYGQIIYNLNDDRLEGGLRSLFIGNLVENYFTNLRSIYDHLATFPRIVCNKKLLKDGLLRSNSYNDLIGLTMKHAKIIDALSVGIVWAIEESKSNFEVIKNIRDAIIHQGKDTVITVTQARKVYFKIPKKAGIYNSDNLVPNLLGSDLEEFELLHFLKHITRQLLIDMEKLGNTIAEVYITPEIQAEGLMLYALTGICMKPFMTFLFPEGREESFYKNALLANQQRPDVI